MTSHEKHNELARRFVIEVAAEARTDSELMVVVESALLAAMLVLRKRHGLQLTTCVEMVETAVQQATDRFSAQEPRP